MAINIDIIIKMIYTYNMGKDNSFFQDIERASTEELGRVREVASELGFDGTPHESFDDILKKGRKKKRGGRPKGSKTLTLKERLRRRGYFE